ncbi:LPXTG cell wall anchor domain-containing protein [Streptomyces cirratus]
MDEDVWSDTVWAESKITKGSGSGGNQPKPDGGTTPIVDHGNPGTGTGTGTGTGGNTGTGTTNTAGQLAETGTDAATSWALGAGGVALAMGAALVAGTGRRRRTTA